MHITFFDPLTSIGTGKSDTTTRDHQRGEPGRVPPMVWSPPLARDIPYPQLGDASLISSQEVPPLVVLVSLLLPPTPERVFQIGSFFKGPGARVGPPGAESKEMLPSHVLVTPGSKGSPTVRAINVQSLTPKPPSKAQYGP